MAGRPSKVYTIEDIEAKLEPWALSYLYLPEQEARQQFLFKEREKVLTSEGKLYDTVFSGIDQQSYMDIIVNIVVRGPQSPYFDTLPTPVKEKIIALESRPTPKTLRHPFEVLQENLEKGEDFAKQHLKAVYNATKFINLYYKWVLTPPTNGRPNFYSCYTRKEYPQDIKSAFRHDFTGRCEMAVDLNDTVKTAKKQEDLFDIIKEIVLKAPAYIRKRASRADKSPSDLKAWKIWGEPKVLRDNLDAIDQIEKALEAVTLEEITARPSTKKEKEPSLFTGRDILQGAGHIPLVEEFSKLGERDAVKCMLSGVKHYENNHSDMMLDMVKSKYLTGKEILKDVLTDKIIRTSFHIGTQLEGREFFKTGIIKISKDEFMRFMGIEDAKIPDETTRRNFTKDTTEQLEMLLNCTFFMRKGGGGGAGCHILDAYSTKSQEFYIRLGKEFVETVTRYGKIAWTPTSLQANRIPNRNKVEYFLQIKLENDFTSIYTQANERDTLKVSTLLNYLEEYGAINTENRKYKEKVIDRFIEALDYLQNVNKSIEYYFTTAPDKDAPAIEGPELEKYKSKANFSKLYLWYNIPKLEGFRNEEDAKTRIAEKRKRALASQARRERARDNKLGELEAERIDKAREKAETEAQAQSDQSQGKTLDEYFKGNQ